MEFRRTRRPCYDAVDEVFEFERKTLVDLAGSDIADPRVVTAILAARTHGRLMHRARDAFAGTPAGSADVGGASMGRSLLLACALTLSGCVERMFFYPDRVQYMRPADVGLAHEDVDITTADGVRLHGWWLPAQGAARGSVLHLHGNAANVSNYLPLVAWLRRPASTC